MRVTRDDKSFSAAVNYTVGSYPYGVAIADVNADGKPDIVAANENSGTVSVLLNTGSGTTLAFATQVTYSVGSYPVGVAIADVNADGKPDIVAANYGATTVSVLLNTGSGTTLAFATQVTYSVGSAPWGLAIADVNADGKPDIVAANRDSNTVSVLLNTGNGTTLAFATQVTYSVGSGPLGVAIADVNADGKPDIVAANDVTSGTVSVLLNTGSGTTLAFATQVTYSVGSNPLGVAIADVNADGKPDIVAANDGSSTVSVLLNTGSGTTLAFATQVTYSVGSEPYGVAIADVNADGKPDIVAANWGSLGSGTTVSVLLNTGNGTTLAFATQVTYSVGSGPLGVAIADVNADGKPDIVAANSGSTTVSVLLNDGPTRTATKALRSSRTLSLSRTASQSSDVSDTRTLSLVVAKSVIDLSATNTNVLAISGPNDAYVTGYFVSSIGDINKDGRGDFLITTSKTNTTSTIDASSCVGEGYIILGQAGISAFPTSVLSINATQGFTIPGIQGFGFSTQSSGFQTFCQSVGAKAGDVNGDGIDDFLLGTSKTKTYLGPPYNIGAAYLVFGSTSGFSSTFALASLDGTNGFKIGADPICGDTAAECAIACPAVGNCAKTRIGRSLGYAVSGGGDINGDNRSDIVIGDYSSMVSLQASFVVFGQNSSWPALLDVDNVNGATGFKVENVGGYAVNNDGDINGDGIDDLILDSKTGLANIIFGQRNFSAVYNASSLSGVNSSSVVGATAVLGMSFATGDINGDGVDDLVIATPAPNFSSATSSVYVIFGSGSWPTAFNVSSLNGINGFVINGLVANRTLGVSIATGDVNADGKADLIVAESDNACVSGSVYVVLGKSSFSGENPFDLATLDGTNGGTVINVPGCSSQGFTVSSGDIDGQWQR